jgi:peptidoglycan glycosyltransferase
MMFRMSELFSKKWLRYPLALLACVLTLVLFLGLGSSDSVAKVEKTEISTTKAPSFGAEDNSPNLMNFIDSQFSSRASLGLNSIAEIENDFISLRGDLGSLKIAGDKYYSIDQNNRKISYTLDPALQAQAQNILKKYNVPWGALVAIEPSSGKVLAIADYSSAANGNPPVALQATFPAASLFKLITASGAVEQKGYVGNTVINYRGGDYTLNQYNYQPNSRSDHRRMTLADAISKSCNPAMGRVALNNLSSGLLQQYAVNFGFNTAIPFEYQLQQSSFSVGSDDYSIARTAAGFGNVLVSPLHAASIMSTIANNGVMMKPFVVSDVSDGENIAYQASPEVLKTSILPSTAREVLRMMERTVVNGTAKRVFRNARGSSLGNINVAAKTGTLSGVNPKGLYRWLVAAAPTENPQIAIAALVIDNGTARANGVVLGYDLINYYFQSHN